MNKTITSAALIASAASAFAIVGPLPGVGERVLHQDFQVKQQEQKFYCLNIFETAEGSKLLGSCDESVNNKRFGAEVDEQGCTENQAALSITQNINIQACPGFIQL